jgi:hypothetical protein
MGKLKIFLIFMMAGLIPLASFYVCLAWPSSDFYDEEDAIFDDWHVCRTNAYGERGFLQVVQTETGATFQPLIPFESVGEYADTAYRLGEQFVEKYPDRYQRAEKIFEYVRDTVQYLPDIDQFDIGEYALNADEIANIIQTEGIAYGDCEEFAVLLAIMYLGAGYRSAIVIFPGHSGVLLYLPDYGKENVPWSLEGEPGWVWAEATGNTNTLGWTPVGQIGEIVLADEITAEEYLPLWQAPEEELPPETQPPETQPPETPPETKPPETQPPEIPKLPEPKPPETKPPEPSSSSSALAAILPAVFFILMITGIVIFVRRRRRRSR